MVVAASRIAATTTAKWNISGVLPQVSTVPNKTLTVPATNPDTVKTARDRAW